MQFRPHIIILLIAIYFFSCQQDGKKDNAETNQPESGIPRPLPDADSAVLVQKNPKTVPAAVKIHQDTILGAWIRPDGNYILEFTTINEDNSLEANYYNPRPINISLAQVKEEERIKIYVEFDDTNYRGSYYDLLYDPANDALTGNYYQATYGQTFPIAFIRYEEPE